LKFFYIFKKQISPTHTQTQKKKRINNKVFLFSPLVFFIRGGGGMTPLPSPRPITHFFTAEGGKYFSTLLTLPNFFSDAHNKSGTDYILGKL